MTDAIPTAITGRWRRLAGARASRVTSGLINQTFLLQTADARFVLQRLHPVFEPAVNRDIAAVTSHLASRGLNTAELLPTDDGTDWCQHDGHTWRLMTYVPGHTIDAITTRQQASEAGRIAAVYHAALGDFDYDYVAGRGHVHDTPRHLQTLARTVDECVDHRLHDDVTPLAQHVLETSERFGAIDALPLRHCHGDLKISNIVYDDNDNAVCLIDLDTVNRMTWPLEMGDALRSWCNPRTEDQLRADLDLDVLDAVLSGYAGAAPEWLSREEIALLITGLARICLELSARFLNDALRESYFGWDDARWASRGDHNLARGRAMASLYDDVARKRSAAEAVVTRHLGQLPA